jgi:chromosome segregation ATPase
MSKISLLLLAFFLGASIAHAQDLSTLQSALHIAEDEMNKAKDARDDDAKRVAEIEKEIEQQKKELEEAKKRAAQSESRYAASRKKYEKVDAEMDKALKRR